MATITKLFSTGILQSGVELDEITYSTIKVSPTGVYAAQFDEVSLAAGTAERRTSTGTYMVSGYFDEYTTLSGQQEFTTPGTYTWIAPAGVTSVSVVAVGAGGTAGAYGASGGSLAWKNNIVVVPGTGYTVVVGNTNKKNLESPYSFPAESSSFGSPTPLVASGGVGGYSGSSTVRPTIGSGYDGGGRGGAGSRDLNGTYGYRAGAGGGAGGYTGDGGNAATTDNTAGGDGAGGGGGGGSLGTTPGGGGGVGLYGLGVNGSGGASAGSGVGQPGAGGSGGNPGIGKNGGYYGGGSAAIGSGTPTNEGKSGAVRIIWGTDRSFPSTNVGNV